MFIIKKPNNHKEGIEMKKISLILLVLALSALAMADGIPGFHQGNVKSVFDAAKSKKQIVMVDFFTTWCGPCKLIEANIYRHESFLPYTNKMVTYKIDAEKGEGIELAKKYKVRAYPSVIFMDADGNEIERVIGYNPDRVKYLKELDRIIEGKDVPSVWVKNFEAKKTLDLANRLSDYYKYFDTEKTDYYLQEALKMDPNAKDPKTRMSLAVQIGNMFGKNPEQAAKSSEEFLAKYPVDEAYFQVAGLYAFSLKKKDINKAWDIISNAYNKADNDQKQQLSYYYADIKKAAGKSNKTDDLATIKTMDLKTTYGATEAAKLYAQYLETEKAKQTLLGWLKANPNASLSDLNSVGWTAYELKLAQKEFADAMMKKWETTPENERDSYSADTIANLCHDCGEKINAVKYGQIAYDLTPEGTSSKKEMKENLDRYKSGK